MKRTITRREFLKIMSSSGIMVLGAGSLSSPVMAYRGMPPRSGLVDPDKYGLIVLIDGLRADLFFRLLETNKLPHIKEHLVDRGAVMECVG